MDQFQQVIVMMEITDSHWGPRDAQGRRREFTVEDLDALADFGWRLPDLRRFVTACGNAARECSRWTARHRIGSAKLTTAENG